MDLLKVDGLSLRYGSQQILNQVSFSFEHGKITGLLGPNGAGKSSIMKILAGLVYPDSGSLQKNGQPLNAFSQLRESTSYMIDSPAFYPYLSGPQNLKLVAAILNKKKDLGKLLEEVGLDSGSKKKVRNYSTGMKQRLAIAQAMMSDSELLVLDEPFNGLDPNGFQDLITLLRQLNQKGKTIVVSSHLLNELEQLADNFILLHQGNIALDISKAELMRLKKKVVFTFDRELSGEALSFVEKHGRMEAGGKSAVLEIRPGDIAASVERLVNLKAVPVNVETQNLLQEKYLEITA